MIHLNIGSNLDSKHGSKFDNITIAIDLLLAEKLKIKKISNFFKTPSYPNQKLPFYLNIGVLADYEGDYVDLFKKIKFIEKKLGRVKKNKNDPRIIDIDLIDFKQLIKKTREIVLPHPKCHRRNFVLYPIFQIDPNLPLQSGGSWADGRTLDVPVVQGRTEPRVEDLLRCCVYVIFII